MNLTEFKNGTTLTKPWLNIVANTVNARSLLINGVPVTSGDDVQLGSAGGISLVADGLGPILETKGLVAGPGITLTAAADSVTVASDISPGLADQVQSVAPAGLRDTWRIPPGLAFDGAFISYFPGPDILYSGSWPPQYSLDGGITFAPVVFDVPPPGASVTGLFYDGISKFITTSFSPLDPTYTSTDGINYVSSGVIAPAPAFSWQTLWVARLGLWVSGFILDATHGVATSPDGINWTMRVTPDLTGSFNGTSLADSGDLLVLMGSTVCSSTDGIVWTEGTGLTTYCQTLCYSPDRKEFLATAAGSAETFRSTNGTAWVSLGLIARAAAVSLIWVGGDIQQYYLNNPNLSNVAPLYSIWSTPDATKQPFVTTILKGADNRSMAYSATIYDAGRKRFVIGLNTIGVAYSTDRPTILKSVGSGNAYVSQIASLTLAGAQATANLLVGLSDNSRLTIPANTLSVGDVYRLEFTAVLNAAAIFNSCSFNLGTVAGGPIGAISAVAPAGGFTTAPYVACIDIVVASPSLINSRASKQGYVDSAGASFLQASSVLTSGVAFNTSIDQVLTFTYTSPDFTSMTLTQILLSKVASGAD